MKDALFGSLKHASAAQIILQMGRNFGDQSYNLQNLFAEERHRIMRLLSQENLTRLDQLYTQVYRDNYGILMAFHRDELDVPQELQVAAEIAIGHRAVTSLQALERETSDLPMSHPQVCYSHLAELEAIATEAEHLRCRLRIPQVKTSLEQLILRSLWHLFYDFNPTTAQTNMKWIERLIDLGDALYLALALDRAQELYLKGLNNLLAQLKPHLLQVESASPTASADSYLSLKWGSEYIDQLLHLGQKLKVELNSVEFSILTP
jgi:alpha-amylase/alpha-mannosidase (GH57 family)